MGCDVACVDPLDPTGPGLWFVSNHTGAYETDPEIDNMMLAKMEREIEQHLQSWTEPGSVLNCHDLDFSNFSDSPLSKQPPMQDYDGADYDPDLFENYLYEDYGRGLLGDLDEKSAIEENGPAQNFAGFEDDVQ